MEQKSGALWVQVVHARACCVPGMVPKKFFTAQVMPAMPWVLSLAKSMMASAFCSQAV